MEKKSVAEAATFLSKVGVCQWIAQGVLPTKSSLLTTYILIRDSHFIELSLFLFS